MPRLLALMAIVSDEWSCKSRNDVNALHQSGWFLGIWLVRSCLYFFSGSVAGERQKNKSARFPNDRQARPPRVYTRGELKECLA